MNLVGIRIKGAQRFVASIELLGSFARRNNAFFILVVLVVIVVIILLIIIVSTSLRSVLVGPPSSRRAGDRIKYEKNTKCCCWLPHTHTRIQITSARYIKATTRATSNKQDTTDRDKTHIWGG